MTLFSVLDLEDHVKNRSIEENGIFVFTCEVTQELIQGKTLQMCVDIDPHQDTEQMERYQRLDGQLLRPSNAIQHSRKKVIRTYTHDNGSLTGALVKFRVLQWQDFKNRTKKDPEYVAIIPSGTIVYCSLGHPLTTCRRTFLNGSSCLRYIIEGVYTNA